MISFWLSAHLVFGKRPDPGAVSLGRVRLSVPLRGGTKGQAGTLEQGTVHSPGPVGQELHTLPLQPQSQRLLYPSQNDILGLEMLVLLILL